MLTRVNYCESMIALLILSFTQHYLIFLIFSLILILMLNEKRSVVKLPVGPDKVTLADFKNVLNRPNYKFFFKSMDDDFGVVKEEIIEEECPLPCFNGRVVSWLVSADTSILSDSGQQLRPSLKLFNPSLFYLPKMVKPPYSTLLYLP